MAAKGKRIIGIAIGVVAIALFLAVPFLIGRGGFRPLPIPNGYDDYVKAGTLLSGDMGDYPNLSELELKELIATNSRALALVRIGLKKECALPSAANLTNFAGMLPVMTTEKKIAQLLAAEGRLAELEGRNSDAAKSYLDAMRFGNEISRNGFLINRLCGIACTSLGYTALAKLVSKLEMEEMKFTLVRVNEQENDEVTWAEVRAVESICMRHEIRQRPNPLVWIPEWWQSRSFISNTESHHHRTTAFLRLLATELALRCYQTEHGTLARQLDDLVPEYLPRVPEDPFSGKPLVYRAQGTNWLLYSVGLDGQDDNGAPARRGSAQGDLLYDLTW